jgi:hypothetical protein
MVQIHQALHGYADGHRQLACSVSLSTKDTRLMLVMSDVSGPGIASQGLPYLTGYPLAESGMYALAKTWPAPEMSRPGCVWTHTVLIGFADLATLESPSAIAELFQRPTTETPLDVYLADFVVEPQDHLIGRSFSSETSSWFAKLASAVYEHPNAQVWARRREGCDVDDAVLRLWDQQWPRLKRSFRFCTLTSRDRSQEGMPFDLQLIPGSESSSHLRFAPTAEDFEATSKSTGPWLVDLLHDAQFPHASTLRPFLRKLGADMLGGREAMRPFCSLHSALEATDMDSIADAVKRVEVSPMFSASELVRSVVVQAAIANLSSVDVRVLDFVIDNFQLLSEAAVRENQASLAQMLWERDPRRLLELSSDARAEVRDAIRIGAKSIPADEVMAKLPQVSDLAVPLLNLLPATAEVPHFWALTQLLPTVAMRAGVELSNDAVLRAMMLGLKEPTLIQAAVQTVGTIAALDCLQRAGESTHLDDQTRLWMRVVCADTNSVAQFLANNPSLTSNILLLLADAVDSDAVPNDVGVDPWYTALSSVVATEGRLPLELQLFGFRRALGRRSRSVEELLKLTFEPLYAAAKNNSIPEEQWHLVGKALPWALFAEEWDKVGRLRRATARKCLELQLRPEGLIQLVRADDLFLQLVAEIWELWGGSRYIHSVYEVLDRSAPRARLLKGFIKQNSKLW